MTIRFHKIFYKLALFAWVGNTEIKYQHVGIYVRVLHALDKIVTTVLEDEHKSYTENERVSLWFQGYAKGVKKDHTDCSMFLNFILARRPTPNFWVVSMSQLKQFSKCLLWKKKLNFYPFNARLNVGYFVATQILRENVFDKFGTLKNCQIDIYRVSELWFFMIFVNLYNCS